METFFLFLLVGVVAQGVDGALGMAYGVISTSVLLALGVPPATASASVHAAEVFTTAASASSHVWHRNIEWRLFLPLAVAGVIGGVLGAYVLAGIEGDIIKPFIIAYLALIGLWILWRAGHDVKPRRLPAWITGPVGVVGGFLDAIGGGGWGPTVSSAMVGAGQEPRRAIGTVNTAEFFLTVAISATFVWALVTGHWQDAGAIQDHFSAVAGLVVGGLIAAPFAGYIVKKIPRRALTYAVGGLLLVLAAFQGAQLAGLF
ncbi:sulfite exporter TauE/SafE family protein [Brevundimonas sp. S30B]|uniref:sulfite exporter TauE/SafE family protein n=1 Tax=unclassified Brevundimonas TaxID=2622653 RepID=UPI001071FEC8|nr:MULTISPECIES: sulfite exporter TauE/SafE family protein [unclassified Brevundimonas]QBX36552.1 sulfite exporter TauE/SafE family protein [Brevundimonas sp. MF30-B]TFW00852.1 sulfite exporter TauE/SafE family protein [Brevundimonas sp. S30B]